MVEKALTRAAALFYYERIIQLMGIYMGFTYGLLYSQFLSALLVVSTHRTIDAVFLTTMSTMYENVYHESSGIAGLHFLALGLGLSGGSQISAKMLDTVYKYLMKKNNGARKPEYRLRMYSLVSRSSTPWRN
jgi:hypothetical protein